MNSPVDMKSVGRELERFRELPPTRESLAEFVNYLRALLQADAVVIVRYEPKLDIIAEASPSAAITENLTTTAEQAIRSAGESAIVQKFTFRNHPVHLLAAPVPVPGGLAWLSIWARIGNASPEPLLVITQAAATFIPRPPAAAVAKVNPEAELALQLLSCARANQSYDSRLSAIATTLAGFLNAHKLYLARKKLRGWAIPATAKSAPPDPKSAVFHTGVMALRALEEENETDALYEVDATGTPEPVSALGHTFECREIGAGRLRDWRIVAGWNEPRTTAPAEAPGTEGENPKLQKLRSAAALVAPVLTLLERESGTSHQVKKAWAGLGKAGKLIALLVAAGLLLLLLCPFPERIHAHAVLEPVLRRFIASPFDSVLKKVHVAAGSIVKQGDLLAELDDREIRERKAELEAQAASANLQGASDLAESKFGESTINALDAERIGHELEVLRFRENHLRVLSPLDGVVIQGDLERAEGAALGLGRPIMEVAPLDKLIIQIAVRESDAPYVSESMKVILQLNAFPGETFEATITRIHPRAETREGHNVFVAEAEMNNPGGKLRPGMKGDAIVVGKAIPLFWILFRKPWSVVQRWTFW